ncbi:MAG: hypothetical protein ACSLEN_12095 [Candidatus Malihini olakiniferum]
MMLVTHSPRLRKRQVLYHNIVKRIQISILIYDFSANRVVMKNAIAEHLLPHLKLEKIAVMARASIRVWCSNHQQ